MKIDKMDQTAGVIPTLWALLNTPLFKGGARLQVSMIGSLWSGTKHTNHHITTVFPDCTHGAEMQISTVMLLLWQVAMKEGHLPEEWVIGADNTPKETKNQYFIFFLIWLLCIAVQNQWVLWSIVLTFLLVGQCIYIFFTITDRLSVETCFSFCLRIRMIGFVLIREGSSFCTLPIGCHSKPAAISDRLVMLGSILV